MNISELERLAIWYLDGIEELSRLYRGLLDPIQYNASQANKQPLESQLDSLLSYLSEMTFEELSLQQLKTLEGLEVDQYLGRDGAKLVESLVRTADYDPSTAATKLTEAVSVIHQAQEAFSAVRSTFRSLHISLKDQPEPSDGLTIRIGFQGEASIKNVPNWKSSAEDWYNIIRGVSLATNEPPENTQIIGASTGSIILILTATAAVTALLAIISKHVGITAREVITIQESIEDLRHKKVLNAAIERELKKQEQKVRSDASKTIMNELKRIIPNLNGEQENGLDLSVKKLLDFGEKGGNIDFVAPDGAGQVGAEGDISNLALADVQTAVREYQAVRESLKRLTDSSSNDT